MNLLNAPFKMLDSFLNPQKGYEKAGQEMQQYYRDAQGNIMPFTQGGIAQLPRLNQQANRLNDPAKLQGQWAKSYEMSPQAQQLQQQARETGMNEASSMGLMGSSSALQNVQNTASNIMSADKQKYLDDLMNKYLASIGIGQNLYGVGAQTGGQQSQNAMNMGQNMAGLKYGKTNAPGELLSKLLGGGANALINYATGGISGAAKGAAA